MIDRICKSCKSPFKARKADVKRGWGKFCSKSCKAIKQTQQTGYAGPDYENYSSGGCFLGSETDIRPKTYL